VHRWLEGGEAPRSQDHDVEKARDGLKQLGLSPEQIEQQMGEWSKDEPTPPIEDLPLPVELRHSVLVFASMATQWKYVAPGLGKPIPVGLDYVALDRVIRMRGVPRALWAEVFDDVRYMEAVALPVLAS
jgi:hypothetical protein